MRYRLYIVLGAFAVLLACMPNVAQACFCNRVYSSYYVDPCSPCAPAQVGCPVSQVGCAVPQVGCPTAQTCTTTTVQRCYLSPELTYRTVTRLEPQTVYVRRAYYDPYSCCYRSYYTPATEFVQRSYQIPVTTYVQRWVEEPQTVCSSSYLQPESNGKSNGKEKSGNGQGSEREPTDKLERPVHREPADKSAPEPGAPSPPKPIPMPAPGGSASFRTPGTSSGLYYRTATDAIPRRVATSPSVYGIRPFSYP